MKLEDELRQLFGRAEDAPWPGEREAFDRFLRRRSRRGRAVAAAAGLALVAVLAGAVLVPRLLPENQTAATATTVVRVESQGFELRVPDGWKVERELTGTRAEGAGGTRPGGSGGAPRPTVVGVVLAPRSGAAHGATITVATDDNQELDYSLVQSGSRRADGRQYRLHPGSGQDEVGRYAVLWPDYCSPRLACLGDAWPRILLVTGSATTGKGQVLEAMRKVVTTVRPITNSVPPPPPPTIPAGTKVLLGRGGSGAAAWEAWIEPIKGNNDSAGFSVHFPRATPKPTWHWEQLEPRYLQRDGVYTQMDCLSWLPGSGLLLSGLAREDAATVRIELAGQSPVVAATFARDQPVPWVAFVSPPLPVGSKLDRVVALDAAGKVLGTQERPYEGTALCRSRAG